MTDHLRPDSRWQTSGVKSMEDFASVLNVIAFVEGVSEDVRRRFDRVRGLIEMSLYNYELLDVAADYALLTVQLAIYQRYLQLEGKEPEEDRLFDLINWGIGRDLFESDGGSLTALRHLRNFAAHPERYTLLGIQSLDLIVHTVGLINGMYENLDLRRQRKGVTDETNKVLQNIAANGAIVQARGTESKVFKAVLLHYENRVRPPIFYFAFWKMFDMTPDENNTIHEGEPLIVPAIRYETLGDSLVLTAADSSVIKIVKPSSLADTEELVQWISDLTENHTSEAANIEFELSLVKTQIQRYHSNVPAASGGEV